MSSAASSSAPEKALDPNDITLRAADRLEAALERLATALEARENTALEARENAALEARENAALKARQPVTTTEPAAPAADMVARAEVERLSARLDDALGRLRALVGDDAGADI